jgi:PAS domain-containing protein
VSASDPSGRGVDAALLEESAEELYEHAPCGYLSTMPDGTIVKVNQTLIDWTGADRAALINGVKFQTLLTIGSRIYYETHYAPLMRMQGFANEIAME